MSRRVIIAAMAALCIVGMGLAYARQRPEAAAENLVLITFDGARTEEVFGGLDLDVLRSTLKEGKRPEDTAAYRRFWAPSPEERRRKLMPFFWTLVNEHGSIAGDRSVNSTVHLGNRHWFSYPGYAEILLGEPHDADIKSNAPLRNPYTTVLEQMRKQLNLPRDKVATFASWAVLSEIAEHTEGTTLINAGIESLDNASKSVQVINGLQREVPTPWDVTRFDAFTFRLAMAHLASARPRVLYIAFDETDDWAHDGRYDLMLDAYARTDGYLKELWDWLQNDPAYRGRTHLLITTDHGRGRTPQDWRDHSARVPGSEDVWMAFASPRMPQRGVWRDSPPLLTSQIAATLASWMGVDWNSEHPQSGRPVQP